MRVVIFGAAGKTGGLLVDRALAKGYEVTVLVRKTSKFRRRAYTLLQETRQSSTTYSMQCEGKMPLSTPSAAALLTKRHCWKVHPCAT